MNTSEGIETEYEPIEGGSVVALRRGAGGSIEDEDRRGGDQGVE
jgi:hypothetical protein